MRTILFYVCCAALVIGFLWMALSYVPAAWDHAIGIRERIDILWKPWVLVILAIIGISTSQRKF
jgi:hypothetical protein